MTNNVVPASRQTKIILDESGEKLPEVQRELNGQLIESKSVLPADLMKMMIENSDEWMLYQAIVQRSTPYFNMMERLLEYQEKELEKHDVANQVMAELVDFARKKKGDRTFLELFHLLCAHVNTTKLDMVACNRILQSILKGMDSQVESDELILLTRTLLERLHFFDRPEVGVIQSIMDVVMSRVKELGVGKQIEEMWSFLAERVSQSTVLQVATKYMDDLVIETPILPKNCVYYRSSNARKVVALHIEKQKWDVNLLGDWIPLVGHPHMLFIFDLTAAGHVSPKLFAMKDPIVSFDTKLYRYPFSNVGDHGSCCWGSFPQVTELRQLESFPGIFMSGERNFHMYPKTGGYEYRELLMNLSGNDFDDDLLRETKHTVGTLFGLGEGISFR